MADWAERIAGLSRRIKAHRAEMQLICLEITDLVADADSAGISQDNHEILMAALTQMQAQISVSE